MDYLLSLIVNLDAEFKSLANKKAQIIFTI